MSKTLIIYSSKYGTTKQYAQWLAEDLQAHLVDVKRFKKCLLKDYDTIVIGGGLYAGSIKSIELIVKHHQILKDKKVVVFTCGLSDVTNTGNIGEIRKRIEKIIPKSIMLSVKLFFLRGGIDYSKLTFIHKVMMAIVKKLHSQKPYEEMNAEAKEFVDTYGKTVSFMDRNSIKEIVDYIRST